MMTGVYSVLLAVLLAGCARTRRPPQLTSAETHPSDDRLAVQIDERLGERPHLSMAARDVWVSVERGVATLRGTVSSPVDREAVHVIAEETPGIAGVADQLVVSAKEPSKAESDRVITDTALRALRTDPALRGLVDDLHLRCDGGVIMIRRAKLTQAQDRAITQLLEKMPGVIVVTDEGVVRD
jgi:hypothetical protein